MDVEYPWPSLHPPESIGLVDSQYRSYLPGILHSLEHR